MRKTGQITKKILLLLLSGALTTSPRTSRRIWGEIFRLCCSGKRQNLSKAATAEMVRRRFHYLKSARLVSWQEFPDGSIKIGLSRQGERRALQFKLDEMQIQKPRRWDGKWWIVVFDVPETKRRIRNALRSKLRDLGFLQIQKSVWVFPFPCEDEIDFIAQVFGAERFLVLAEAIIKHDRVLRDWFDLP